MQSVFAEYTLAAAQTEPNVSAFTRFALRITAAQNETQLETVLRLHLSDVGIAGIALCLCPFMTTELTAAKVTLIVPAVSEDLAPLVPFTVREPPLFPKRLLAAPTRLILALLVHNGMYLGYAYFVTGNDHREIADAVKNVLSQTLYALYEKAGKTKSRALIITDREKLTQAIHIEETVPRRRSKLTAKSITDYLLDHLGEMTDLDAMTVFFGLSKSHLTRRCRELTGYSVQTLHERLKIEQAKDLIKSGNSKMNDISLRLGFSNPNYFSNVFKKVTGLSPVAWKKRNVQ